MGEGEEERKGKKKRERPFSLYPWESRAVVPLVYLG